MQVKSTIKLNMPRINQLTQAAVRALEQTAEELHTEVVQAQVMPFDTGHLEEDATFVDDSEFVQWEGVFGFCHTLCQTALLSSRI